MFLIYNAPLHFSHLQCSSILLAHIQCSSTCSSYTMLCKMCFRICMFSFIMLFTCFFRFLILINTCFVHSQCCCLFNTVVAQHFFLICNAVEHLCFIRNAVQHCSQLQCCWLLFWCSTSFSHLQMLFNACCSMLFNTVSPFTIAMQFNTFSSHLQCRHFSHLQNKSPLFC